MRSDFAAGAVQINYNRREMDAMEAAKAALRATPITIEQFKRINRMQAIDKLMPASIASGLELQIEHVEAALWKPAPAKSAYMAFQAFKSSEVRLTVLHRTTTQSVRVDLASVHSIFFLS